MESNLACDITNQDELVAQQQGKVETADLSEHDQKVKVVPPSSEQLPEVLMTLLFAHGKPLMVDRLSLACGASEEEVEVALGVLKERLLSVSLGIELIQVASAFQLRSMPGVSHYIRNLKTAKPKKLSAQAVETLAIIAYRQPIVKSDIEMIRGVDATPTMKTLIDRKLIRIIGHQPTVGQPALYGTTDEFLNLFGLSSLKDLPTLRDLQAMESDPGEEGSDQVEDEFVEEIAE